MGVLLQSYFVFHVAFLELNRNCCQGLVYIDLVSTCAEKQLDIMRNDVGWYGKEYLKNYEGRPMRHSLNKIFQKAIIFTEISIRVFFSILELVPRPLYLSFILGFLLIIGGRLASLFPLENSCSQN